MPSSAWSTTMSLPPAETLGSLVAQRDQDFVVADIGLEFAGLDRGPRSVRDRRGANRNSAAARPSAAAHKGEAPASAAQIRNGTANFTPSLRMRSSSVAVQKQQPKNSSAVSGRMTEQDKAGRPVRHRQFEGREQQRAGRNDRGRQPARRGPIGLRRRPSSFLWVASAMPVCFHASFPVLTGR